MPNITTNHAITYTNFRITHVTILSDPFGHVIFPYFGKGMSRFKGFVVEVIMNAHEITLPHGRSIGKFARTVTIVYMLSGGRDISTEFYLSSFSEPLNQQTSVLHFLK